MPRAQRNMVLKTRKITKRIMNAAKASPITMRRRRIKPGGYLRLKYCGFSDRTVRALLAGGIDAPERVLSMAPDQIRLIRGIGPTLMKEVERYRAQFK